MSLEQISFANVDLLSLETNTFKFERFEMSGKTSQLLYIFFAEIFRTFIFQQKNFNLYCENFPKRF